jgi:hypothetical protein
MTDPRQQDAEYLKLLAIFHYVVAGMMALWASFPIIHFLVGLALLFGKFEPQKPDQPPLQFFGLMFALVSGAAIAVGWTLALCTFFAGRNLVRRRNYMYCLVMAGIMAVTCMPMGTILGTLTIIVLLRPSVKEAFGVPASLEGSFEKPGKPL